MRAIYFLGECMVELRGSHNSTFEQAFAGDVYNSAVYLKRAFTSQNTGLITVVGHDTLSDKMLRQFAAEQLDTHMVFRHDDKVPGMYLIELDDKGERSFVYWRSDAAARQIMQFLNAESLATIKPGDSLFFSGISLAVIDESDRRHFWRVVKQLQQAGVKIIFDPNYRPACGEALLMPRSSTIRHLPWLIWHYLAWRISVSCMVLIRLKMPLLFVRHSKSVKWLLKTGQNQC